MSEDRKILQDRFDVIALDPNNKTPFRNVARVQMKSEYKLQMEVDINTQIYPVASNDSFLIKVSGCASTKNVYSQEELNKASDKDNFDYVMFGTVFDIEEKSGDLIVHASFGGLIMRVVGKANSLSAFRKEGTEARIYLMIRKA